MFRPLKFLIFGLGLLIVVSLADSNVLKARSEELDDLIKPKDPVQEQQETKELRFTHHDEDQFNTKEALKDLKLDVEILESNEIQKENNEFEEQFRGQAALKTDTENFSDENIEMLSMDETMGSDSKHHLYTTIAIFLLAIVSISIYAMLVIWRTKLENRYGMRELLVTDDFDEYYRQHQRTDSLPYVNYNNNSHNHLNTINTCTNNNNSHNNNNHNAQNNNI